MAKRTLEMEIYNAIKTYIKANKSELEEFCDIGEIDYNYDFLNVLGLGEFYDIAQEVLNVVRNNTDTNYSKVTLTQSDDDGSYIFTFGNNNLQIKVDAIHDRLYVDKA